ncbi:MAG: radical SAM protein, partial [Desulfuromonadales bacterium]|nr:radical SAM protein [Desulfuromonadales bacterium]
MSRAAKQKQPDLLSEERNLCPPSHERSILNVCLVYPNRYQTGMSNLGFQTVYSLFAMSPGITCERAFLPDRAELEEHKHSNKPILSLESRLPLADFDLIAFSTSFEPDYLNIALMLHLSCIPLLSRDRDESHPLVIAGGAALFINPEPVADLMDLICIGEGEGIIPGLLATLMSPEAMDRRELLVALSGLTGIYIPRFHHPRHQSGRLVGFETETGIPCRIERVCAELEKHPPAQTVI